MEFPKIEVLKNEEVQDIHDSALRILDGDFLLGKEVFDMSPLYPYLLALIYSIFDIFCNRSHNIA